MSTKPNPLNVILNAQVSAYREGTERPIAKAHHDATNRTINGKIVPVAAYDDKRPSAHPTLSGEHFGAQPLDFGVDDQPKPPHVGPVESNTALESGTIPSVIPATSAAGATEHPMEEKTTAKPRERIYLSVPFDEKDIAKAAGAKWDGDHKKWYWPKGDGLPPSLEGYISKEQPTPVEPAPQQINLASNGTIDHPSLVPPLPQTLPDKPIEIWWAPQGAKAGTRLYANLSPFGPGHKLTYHLDIRRSYTDGQPIGGTAARESLEIRIAVHPEKGWMAQLSPSIKHTAPLNLSGKGDLSDATTEVEKHIKEYILSHPQMDLGGKRSMVAGIHAPTGGELIDFGKEKAQSQAHVRMDEIKANDPRPSAAPLRLRIKEIEGDTKKQWNGKIYGKKGGFHFFIGNEKHSATDKEVAERESRVADQAAWDKKYATEIAATKGDAK